MVRLVFILLILFPAIVFAQCKTYHLGVKGDTLNCTDNNNLKQGKWVSHIESLRGEPGYEEEGMFKDGVKIGTWRTYSLMGDILTAENFRFGYKDGLCSYYNLNGLLRQESWKAIDPKYPYDTVDVYDLNNPDIVYKKVVKIESSSVKHGVWTYYDPATGGITKTEEYILDQLVDPLKKKPITAANKTPADSTTIAAKAKPTEVLQYEKKNSNKKKIKVRDGATGVPL